MAEKAKAVVSTTIAAPLELVFNFVVNPYNMPGVWPSLQEAKNVKQLPGGGYTYDWTYKMAWFKFKGSTKTLEYIPNKSLVDQTVKGIDSKFSWTFEREGPNTVLAVEVVYNIPIPLVGKTAEAIIVSQNQRESEVMFANIKNAVEEYWQGRNRLNKSVHDDFNP